MSKVVRNVLYIFLVLVVATFAFFGGRYYQYRYSNTRVTSSEKALKEYLGSLESECKQLQDDCCQLYTDKQKLLQDIEQLQKNIERVIADYDKKIKLIRTYDNVQCDSAFRARYPEYYGY